MLLCERPHVKDVDFDTSRFIVSTAVGLNIQGQHLIMGDEVPRGVLNDIALRQIYEPPLRLIETFEYVRQDPALTEACTRQGTVLEDLPDLTQESDEAVANVMCDECGVFYEEPKEVNHTHKMCKRFQKKGRN